LSGLQPKEAGKGLSTNDYDNTEKSKVTAVTPPDAITLTTGSNAILLTNLIGQRYNQYDMASGALTLTAGTAVENGSAYGSIVSDATTQPVVSAFTAWDDVTYDNTNDKVNHFVIQRIGGVNYIKWHQLP